jgi:hypothetical protein
MLSVSEVILRLQQMNDCGAFVEWQRTTREKQKYSEKNPISVPHFPCQSNTRLRHIAAIGKTIFDSM